MACAAERDDPIGHDQDLALGVGDVVRASDYVGGLERAGDAAGSARALTLDLLAGEAPVSA